MKIIFTLFAAALITTSSIGQIIYNDIADQILSASATPGTDYDLDIDGNGSNDFKVNMLGDVATAGYGNFIAGTFSAMNGALKEAIWGDALYLISGDTIGASSLTWTDFSSDLPVTIFAGGASYGQEWLVPVTDGYFGFKFEISGNLHYGWMRMDVDDATVEMTIKDWAYNSTPDEMILAGQTTIGGTGIENGSSQNVRIYQSGDQLNIQTTNQDYSNYIIYDLTGKIISRSSITNSNEKMNLTGLKNGIYIISLIGNNEQLMYQQKISIL